MDERIKNFFEERDKHVENYIEALELIRNEWMIDYKISAATTIVLIEITFYGWRMYAPTLEEAVKAAVNFVVTQLD